MPLNSKQSLCKRAEAAIRAAKEQLPDLILERLAMVPVSFDLSRGRQLRERGEDEDLLGLFVGDAYPDEGLDVVPLPPHIILFLDNIRDYSKEQGDSFAYEVVRTYIHEVGHFLGYDEEDLIKRCLD